MPSSPYKLLELQDWRDLLGHAAFYHAARAELSRLIDERESMQTINNLLSTLDIAARQTSEDDDDDTAVAFVITQLAGCIEGNASLPRLDDDEKSLLQQLSELVALANADDPLLRIFEAVQTQASGLYGQNWRRARLSVAATDQHPRAAELANDPYPVTAYTPFPPEDDSEVELRIWLSKFSPAAFAVVPMLLAHEFICHMPAVQDKPKSDSDFAEGFLDWAAHYFCNRWAPAIDRDMAVATRDHAKRLRTVMATRPRAPHVTARELGHKAASRLALWFETTYAVEIAEAEARVATLAIELNVVDRPLDDKDLFVSYLTSPRFPPQVEAGLSSWWNDEAEAGALLLIKVGES